MPLYTAPLPRGVVLSQENTPGLRVFPLRSGWVKLSCTSRNDRTLLLKVALPGDILGLSAVLSSSRYEVTAETICPTTLRSVTRDSFRFRSLETLLRDGMRCKQRLHALARECIWERW